MTEPEIKATLPCGQVELPRIYYHEEGACVSSAHHGDKITNRQIHFYEVVHILKPNLISSINLLLFFIKKIKESADLTDL